MQAKPKRMSLGSVSVKAILIGFYVCTANAQSDFWEQTNGPFGGTIQTLGVGVQGEVFAVTWGPGVFRSNDNGASWIEVSKGLSAVSDIVIGNGGDIFVASSEGLFRSANNGDSWEQIDDALARSRASALGININGHIFASTENGLIRSTDHGASWAVVDSSLTPGAFAFNSAGHIFAASGGVILSTDNGDTWIQINTGLTSTSVTSIAINGSDDIFVGTGAAVFPPEAGQGVFRSTDNGDSWTQITTGLTANHVWALGINAAGDIFAGTKGEGVFRSTDNGDSWSQVNNGFDSRWARAFAITSTSDIFVGTENTGIFRSRDNGDSWQQFNQGIAATSINVIGSNGLGDIFVSTGELDLAAEGGFGLFRSTDDGDSWHEIVEGLPPQPYVSAIGVDVDGTVFVGASAITGSGIFRSADNGDTWNQVDSTQIPNSFVFNSTGDILAGGGGILRSSDNGDSWTQIGADVSTVQTLAINSYDTIFAGTSVGVYRSADNGDSWSLLGDVPSDGSVDALAIHPAGHIFAAVGFAEAGGVFRSSDNGDSWSRVQDSSIVALTIDAAGHIYAGGSGGVYLSNDNGDSWMAINAGLDEDWGPSLGTNAKGEVFAGTAGRGVFRFIRGATAIEEHSPELPSAFSLQQNHPNLFNPNTTINYELPRAGHVALKIYNTLGQEIRTLVNKVQPVGTHQVVWDDKDDHGKMVASGLYFYRLKAGSFVDTRKMVLLR